MERANRAHTELRGELVREVRRLAKGLEHAETPAFDAVALIRSKIEPMVRGLFPRIEQEAVLATLERSVVFLTSANIESVLFDRSFDHSAWTLANLYLTSVGARLLAQGAPRLVGISEETKCFVSVEYFGENLSRISLSTSCPYLSQLQTSRPGFPRDVEEGVATQYRIHEARDFRVCLRSILVRVAAGKGPAERRALAEEYSRRKHISEERVDTAEVPVLSRRLRRLATAGR